MEIFTFCLLKLFKCGKPAQIILMSQNKSFVIRLKLQSASGIRDTSFFGVQAPYVKIWHGYNKYESKIDFQGGTAPIWDEEFQIPYHPGHHLNFRIKNWGFVRHSRIGRVTIYSEDLEKYLEEVDKELRLSLPVLNYEEKRKGEMLLVLKMQEQEQAAPQQQRSWYSFLSGQNFQWRQPTIQYGAQQRNEADDIAKV
eukprot:TRINITY_DN3058_c0_g1_i1.p2 TRINITY_DN3058_c0_g1~~TRINITY_DN3058_c0_g1_i1.p2  ORF type:complete len:197 (-),score=10.67 TRINITY_DN3058_c0_g1_i1:554-1144(-)